MNITKSLFPVGGAYPYVKKLNESLQKLQVQLATQQKASTLSELGSERVFDLSLRSRLSRLDAFKANVDTTNLRLDFLDNSISRLNEIEGDTRGSLNTSGVGADSINIVSASETAYNRLDEIMAILNGDLNGRYMFAGQKTDSEPVVSANVLINGKGTQAGLKTVLAERKQADLGSDSNIGRLVIDQTPLTSAMGASNEVVLSDSVTPTDPTIASVTTNSASFTGNITQVPNGGTPATTTVAFGGVPSPGETVTVRMQYPGSTTTADFTFTAVSGAPTKPGEFQIGADADQTAANFKGAFDEVFHDSSVTLTEDGAHPFGVKLTGATTDSAGISLRQQVATQPASVQVRVDAQPAEGEKITISYALPDGSEGKFDMVATHDDPPARGQFLIDPGGDTNVTAANIGSAITEQLKYLRDTDLSGASASRATEQFVTTDGSTPMRVDPGGGDLAHATAEIAGTTQNTVTWYKGQVAANARATASARVDESTVANYGVLANEQGIADLIRANAVMAAETFSADPSVEPNGADRYQATAKRQVTRLATTNNTHNGSLDVIALELGLSRVTVGSASDRHASYGSQLETMLSDVESVDVNEVAMQLLTIRTNLEASYQTMSTLSQLSLVNYMR